jgi:hypothetical protein
MSCFFLATSCRLMLASHVATERPTCECVMRGCCFSSEAELLTRGPTTAQVALGLHLVKFTETLEDMLTELSPNRLTEYVYELANLFSTFYTECKVKPHELLS